MIYNNNNQKIEKMNQCHSNYYGYIFDRKNNLSNKIIGLIIAIFLTVSSSIHSYQPLQKHVLNYDDFNYTFKDKPPAQSIIRTNRRLKIYEV